MAASDQSRFLQWTQQFVGLAGLSQEVRSELEGSSRIRKISLGARVFGPGRESPGLLFLLAGTVRVHQRGENGRDIVLYRVTAGESCVLTNASHFAHLNSYAEGVAETDLMVAEVPRSVFDRLLGESSEFRAFVLAAYSRRIVDLFRVIDDVVYGRMDLRIAERLLQLADDSNLIRVTHQDLADELGTAREVVSRQISEFQKRGWVRQGRGRIYLVNVVALEHFAKSA